MSVKENTLKNFKKLKEFTKTQNCNIYYYFNVKNKNIILVLSVKVSYIDSNIVILLKLFDSYNKYLKNYAYNVIQYTDSISKLVLYNNI